MSQEQDIRDDVLEAIENGVISKDQLITAVLDYMRAVEIEDMLHTNEIFLDGPVVDHE